MKKLFYCNVAATVCLMSASLLAVDEAPVVVSPSITIVKPGTRIILGNPEEVKGQVEEARLSDQDLMARAEAEKNLPKELTDEGKITEENGKIESAPMPTRTEEIESIEGITAKETPQEVILPEQPQEPAVPASVDETRKVITTEEIVPAVPPAETVSQPVASLQQVEQKKVETVKPMKAKRRMHARKRNATCPSCRN